MTERETNQLRLAEKIRDFYGYSNVLMMEETKSTLPLLLRREGLVVIVQEISPAVIPTFLEKQANDQDQKFNLIVVDFSFDINEVGVFRRMIEAVHARTGRYALLIVRCTQTGAAGLEYRGKCEDICFEMGFRKHAGYYTFNEYSSLQIENSPLVIPLEKIPKIALERYPLEVLMEERSLHMDMMRETGSRSDAHIIRYALAARHIRPGDRVIDAACGLGYGTHALSQLSSASHVRGVDASEFSTDYANLNYGKSGYVDFICGYLPDCLLSIPSDSCDVIVTFETLEHVADAMPVLREFHRILTPGGRIIASVPNDWTDETGKDPNPYHLQVYTMPKFLSEVSAFFKVEALQSQTANRVKKVGGRCGEFVPRPRSITTIAHDDSTVEVEAEWFLLFATKNVAGGLKVPFADRIFSEDERRSVGPVLAIGDHYDNPWIFRSIVLIGARIENPATRRDIAQELLPATRTSSADRGACLCILIYIYLDAEEKKLPQDLIDAIDMYINISEPESATVLRWQISLAFARALLAHSLGNMEAAEGFFMKVLNADCLAYSVTLMTKPADAAFRLGCIYLSQDRPDLARDLWVTQYAGIRNSVSKYLMVERDEISPTFELNEIGEVFSRLGRIAGALRFLDQASVRPLAVAVETQRDPLSQNKSLSQYVDQLLETKEWLLKEIQRAAGVADEKDAWAYELTKARDWWQAQYQSLQETVAEDQKLLSQQSDWIGSLTEGKMWLEAQWNTAIAALEEKNAIIAELRSASPPRVD